MIKYNNKNIGKAYFNNAAVGRMYFDNIVAYGFSGGGGGHSWNYCYDVTPSIASYTATTFSEVYDTSSGKWYMRNNLNQYEEYGVYATGNSLSDITTYVGKLAVVGGYEYRWTGSSWENLGSTGGGGKTSDFTLSDTDGYYDGTSTIPADSFVMFCNNNRYGSYSSSTSSYIAGTSSANRLQSLSAATNQNITMNSSYVTDGAVWKLEDAGNGLFYVKNVANSKYIGYDGRSSSQGAPMVSNVSSAVMVELFHYTATTLSYEAYRIIEHSTGNLYGINNLFNRQKDYNWWDENVYTATDDGNSTFQVIKVLGSQIVYPVEYSSKEEPDNNLTFNTIEEANAYTGCVYNGIRATIGGSMYELNNEEWVKLQFKALLTLNDSSTVEIAYNDDAELKQSEISGYSGTVVSAVITNQVTSIGSRAFYNCTSLSSVTIPDSVTTIGGNAFQYCYKLTSVTIPNSVTSIGSNTFQYCYSLASVTISSSVTSIGNGTFYNCSALTEITIPNSVTSIGNQAFGSCSSLTSITIPDSVTSIGQQAFGSCSSLTSITIGTGVTSIESYTFYDCDGLTSVIIPDSVTSIGSYAFQRCNGLTSVTIPNSVTSIREYAFNECTSLSSVTIGSGVTSIRDYAFASCSGLTSVTIPSSVTSIGKGTFVGCSSLTTITVNGENTKYDSRDNCNAIILTASNQLIQGCNNTVIPNSITSIGDNAFQYCSGLTSVTIPDSVTSIGKNAFNSCRGLTSVTIGSGVTSIGYSAFYYCTNLTSITIPNSVTSIGDNAFYYCWSLTSITSNATTAPTIQSSTFGSVKTGGTLYYPSGSDYSSWLSTSNYYLGKYGWTGQEI